MGNPQGQLAVFLQDDDRGGDHTEDCTVSNLQLDEHHWDGCVERGGDPPGKFPREVAAGAE
jgi:hypothetical protein